MSETLYSYEDPESGEIFEAIIKSAEPIVRCRDCKYWNKHHFVDIYVCSIHNKEGQYPYLLFEMSADDFCSRGVRR